MTSQIRAETETEQELKELNPLAKQENRYRCKVQATIDSGAAVSVIPNGWLTDYLIKATAESSTNYKAAGGALIRDEGLRQLNGLMPGEKKTARKLNVRVAKVKKM